MTLFLLCSTPPSIGAIHALFLSASVSISSSVLTLLCLTHASYRVHAFFSLFMSRSCPFLSCPVPNFAYNVTHAMLSFVYYSFFVCGRITLATAWFKKWKSRITTHVVPRRLRSESICTERKQRERRKEKSNTHAHVYASSKRNRGWTDGEWRQDKGIRCGRSG